MSGLKTHDKNSNNKIVPDTQGLKHVSKKMNTRYTTSNKVCGQVLDDKFKKLLRYANLKTKLMSGIQIWTLFRISACGQVFDDTFKKFLRTANLKTKIDVRNTDKDIIQNFNMWTSFDGTFKKFLRYANLKTNFDVQNTDMDIIQNSKGFPDCR